MEKLYIPATPLSPEISFDPDTWLFQIKGFSAPEDVRTLYYPVIDWITAAADSLILNPELAGDKSIRLEIDLNYFNSSSGKFLHDIFSEMARMKENGCSVEIIWYYEADDSDMHEAGLDMSALAGMEFTFVSK